MTQLLAKTVKFLQSLNHLPGNAGSVANAAGLGGKLVMVFAKARGQLCMSDFRFRCCLPLLLPLPFL